MATTVSGINETLVDERVQSAFRFALPMLSVFSFGISAEEKIVDDVVYVPIATDPSSAAKTAGTFGTSQGTLAGTSVTLSTFRSASWDFKEGEVGARVFENAWADKVAGAVYVLAKYGVDLALALVTAANYGSGENDVLTVAPADFGPNDLGQLWTKGAKKIKQRQKAVFLNADYGGSLLGESTLATIFSNSGNNFMASGVVPQLLGMPSFIYPDFPANSEGCGGMVVGGAAIGIGIAPPSQLIASGEGDVVERRMVVDADTGATFQLTTKVDAGGMVSGELASLMGAAKLQDGIVRLVNG